MDSGTVILPDLEVKARGIRRLGSAVTSGFGGGRGGGGGVIIDSIGRRFNPALHPRDSRGRFIETGGIARTWGGKRGIVIRAQGDKVRIRLADGSVINDSARRITMVERPDGSSPLSGAGPKDAVAKRLKRVVDEDERRTANPRRGDGVDSDDDGDRDRDGVPDSLDVAPDDPKRATRKTDRPKKPAPKRVQGVNVTALRKEIRNLSDEDFQARLKESRDEKFADADLDEKGGPGKRVIAAVLENENERREKKAARTQVAQDVAPKPADSPVRAQGPPAPEASPVREVGPGLGYSDEEHGAVLNGAWTFKRKEQIKETTVNGRRAFRFMASPSDSSKKGWTATGTPEEREAALEALRQKLNVQKPAEDVGPISPQEAIEPDTTGPPPTEEQKALLSAFRTGQDMVARALAGTGKTTLFGMLARQQQKDKPKSRIAYIAFGKLVQAEADKKMPDNVESRTGDSISFTAASKDMKNKYNNGKKHDGGALINNQDIANYLGVKNVPLGKDKDPLPGDEAVQSAKRIVEKYAISADDEIGLQHAAGLDEDTRKALLPIAERIWADYKSPTGKIKVTNSHLTKMWALTRPDLSKQGSGLRTPADVIFFDEAQDINPVMAKVVRDQKMQKVFAGDSNQAIFGFRGAIDELNKIKAPHDLGLTKSWRFGPEVAEMGNRFLQLNEASQRIEGGGPSSRITKPFEMEEPDAVLVRSNSGAIDAIMRAQARGRVVGVPANAKGDLTRLVNTARWLQGKGKMPSMLHDDLAGYRTWDKVVKDVEEGKADAKVRMLEGIVSRVGVDALGAAVADLVDPASKTETRVPDVTVSTAHKAKGLEWDRVQIGGDFLAPKRRNDGTLEMPSPEEIRLAYVAVTRGRKELDPGSLAWVRDYTDENGGEPGSRAPMMRRNQDIAQGAPEAPREPDVAQRAPETASDVVPEAAPDTERTPDLVPEVREESVDVPERTEEETAPAEDEELRAARRRRDEERESDRIPRESIVPRLPRLSPDLPGNNRNDDNTDLDDLDPRMPELDSPTIDNPADEESGSGGSGDGSAAEAPVEPIEVPDPEPSVFKPDPETDITKFGSMEEMARTINNLNSPANALFRAAAETYVGVERPGSIPGRAAIARIKQALTGIRNIQTGRFAPPREVADSLAEALREAEALRTPLPGGDLAERRVKPPLDRFIDDLRTASGRMNATADFMEAKKRAQAGPPRAPDATAAPPRAAEVPDVPDSVPGNAPEAPEGASATPEGPEMVRQSAKNHGFTVGDKISYAGTSTTGPGEPRKATIAGTGRPGTVLRYEDGTEERLGGPQTRFWASKDESETPGESSDAPSESDSAPDVPEEPVEAPIEDVDEPEEPESLPEEVVDEPGAEDVAPEAPEEVEEPSPDRGSGADTSERLPVADIEDPDTPVLTDTLSRVRSGENRPGVSESDRGILEGLRRAQKDNRPRYVNERGNAVLTRPKGSHARVTPEGRVFTVDENGENEVPPRTVADILDRGLVMPRDPDAPERVDPIPSDEESPSATREVLEERGALSSETDAADLPKKSDRQLRRERKRIKEALAEPERELDAPDDPSVNTPAAPDPAEQRAEERSSQIDRELGNRDTYIARSERAFDMLDRMFDSAPNDDAHRSTREALRNTLDRLDDDNDFAQAQKAVQRIDTSELGPDLQRRVRQTGVLLGRAASQGREEDYEQRRADARKAAPKAPEPLPDTPEAPEAPESSPSEPEVPTVDEAPLDGVPGQWVGGVEKTDDGYEWFASGQGDYSGRFESGQADSPETAREEMLDQARKWGADVPGGDRGEAAPDVVPESVEPEVAPDPEPINGRGAEWAPVADIAVGDVARIDGIDQDGNPVSAVGHVVGGPTQVYLQETRKRVGNRRIVRPAKVRKLAFQVAENPDGTGERSTVFVDPDGMGARAPSAATAPEGAPAGLDEGAVTGGQLPERVPVDSAGAATFPGSTVTEGDRTGTVTAVTRDDVSVSWEDGTVTERPAGALTVTDGGQNRPPGWTQDGRRLRQGMAVDTEDGLGIVESVTGDSASVATTKGIVDMPVADVKVRGEAETPAEIENEDSSGPVEVKDKKAVDLVPGDTAVVPTPLGPQAVEVVDKKDDGDRTEIDYVDPSGDKGKADLPSDADVPTVVDSDSGAPAAIPGSPHEEPEGVEVTPSAGTPVREVSDPTRRALFTDTQRRYLEGLGLDLDLSSDDDVAQGAARVRAGLGLTAPQASALADAVRKVAGTRQKDRDRIANRLDDVSAALRNDSTNMVAVGSKTEKVTAKDLAPDDEVAIVNNDGTVTIGRVKRVTRALGGRGRNVTLENQNGETPPRFLPADAPVWRLADLSPVTPEDPPGDDTPDERMDKHLRYRARETAMAVAAQAAAAAAQPASSIHERRESVAAALTPEATADARRNEAGRFYDALTADGFSGEERRQALRMGHRIATRVEDSMRDSLLAAINDHEPLSDDDDQDAADLAAKLLRAGIDFNTDSIVDKRMQTTAPPANTPGRIEIDAAVLEEFNRLVEALLDAAGKVKVDPKTKKVSRVAKKKYLNEVLPRVRRGDRRTAQRVEAVLTQDGRPKRRLLARAMALLGKIRDRLAQLIRGAVEKWEGSSMRGALARTLRDARRSLTSWPESIRLAALVGSNENDVAPSISFTPQEAVASAVGRMGPTGRFGQKFGPKRWYANITEADLLAGNPIPFTEGDGWTPDRLRDGGPGSTTIQQLDDVRTAGTALDDDANSRLRMMLPDMGDDPVATVQAARDALDAAEADERAGTGSASATDAARRYSERLSARLGKARQEATLGALQAIRPMGPVKGEGPEVTGDPEAVAAVKRALNFLPSDWVRAMSGQKIDVAVGDRGWAEPSTGKMSVADLGERIDGDGPLAASAIHELSHVAEAAVPEIAAMQAAYFFTRTSEGPLGGRTRNGVNRIRSLADLTPGAGHDNDESAREDGFVSPYVGRDYGHERHYEMLALGMESLFSGSWYLDDDLRKFLFGLTATAGGLREERPR